MMARNHTNPVCPHCREPLEKTGAAQGMTGHSGKLEAQWLEFECKPCGKLYSVNAETGDVRRVPES